MEHVSVSVVYPGANAEDIESSIVNNVEQRLKSIPQIEALYSSASSGLAQIDVKFCGNGLAGAGLDTVTACLRGIDDMPDGAQQPIIGHHEGG